ncbi:MAG: ribonuclease D [Pseudomonadota bacterium]
MKIITTTADLAETCQQFAQQDRPEPYITVDTEFLRETTFWPQLCLIQMASPDEAVIIDSMADGLDLKPFLDLMADQAIIKVFHAARQDIEIIFQLMDSVPNPVFDTQVAAMVCGYGDQIGYDNLVQRVTGGRIDKTSRFTDWSRRPLSDKQLEYALADVTHLRDVYTSLKQQLEKAGRTKWVSEEMAVLTARETYDSPPEDAWKRMRMRARKPMELAVLQKVAEWREREARERDVPRGRILKDDALYELAQQQPKTADELGRLRAVPRGFEKSRNAEGLLAAVAEALAISRDSLPKIPKARRHPEGTGAAVDLLKVLLKLVAEENGVAAKVLATTDDLEKIAIGDTENVAALRGWRFDLFGSQALELKDGKIALGFDGKSMSVIELED